MKLQRLLFALLFVACLAPFASAQDSTSLTNVSTVRIRGRSSQPSLSTTGNAVFYFDTASGKIKVYQNGGAFGDLVGGGGAGAPYADTTALVKGSADATKLLRFEVDGLTAGATRVITPPDSNTTLPIASQVITWSGPTAARTYTLPDSNATVVSGTPTSGKIVKAGSGSVISDSLLTEGTNTVEQYNSTSAQTFNVYRTRTDASNGEWGFAKWNGTAFEVGTTANGTGDPERTVRIKPGSAAYTFDAFGNFAGAGTLDVASSRFGVNTTNGMQLGNAMPIRWYDTTQVFGTNDLALTRVASKRAKFYDGSTGGAGVEIPGEGSSNGQNLTISPVSENITLSTSGASTTSTIDIPADSFIVSVTARITTTIAGVDSTSVVIKGDDSGATFAQLTALTVGTSTVGLAHHATGEGANATAGKVQISLLGGADNTPSAGAVRITIHYIKLTAPTS